MEASSIWIGLTCLFAGLFSFMLIVWTLERSERRHWQNQCGVWEGRYYEKQDQAEEQWIDRRIA